LVFNRIGKKIGAIYIIAINNKKIGSHDALDIINVPITKYDEAIKQTFQARAQEILGHHIETLDRDHVDELIKIISD